jgi:RimJ/RimL family protein N-acetyltransferase
MGLECIETDRLRLARWEPDRHTDAVVEMNADPEVMRHIGEGRPLARAESEAQSERLAAHWERFGFGLWAVQLRASGAVVGFAGLSHPLWLPAEVEFVEVGWRLSRCAWGSGIASEAGRAGVGAGFGILGLECVVSYIRPANARSQAVSRRLGMELARTTSHPGGGHAIEVWELRAGRAAP